MINLVLPQCCCCVCVISVHVCVRETDSQLDRECYCTEQTSVPLTQQCFVALFWNGNDNEGGRASSYTDNYVTQETANVQSCYHTSKVTHLVDVFGFRCSHLFTFYLFYLLLLFWCFFYLKSVQLDVTMSCSMKEKTLALTETLWMRYKTDHMAACCTTVQLPLCVKQLTTVPVVSY